MGDSDGGVLFIGDKGSLICGCYGRSPELLPADKMQAYKRPKAAIERDPRRRAGTREGLGPRVQGRQAGQFELRLLRPSVGNGAHGEPGRPLSPAQAAVGRREDGSHQRQRGEYVRPPALSRGVDAVGLLGTGESITVAWSPFAPRKATIKPRGSLAVVRIIAAAPDFRAQEGAGDRCLEADARSFSRGGQA